MNIFEHPWWCSICDHTKVPFTSKYSYLFFSNLAHKIKTRIANRLVTTTSNPLGPIKLSRKLLDFFECAKTKTTFWREWNATSVIEITSQSHSNCQTNCFPSSKNTMTWILQQKDNLWLFFLCKWWCVPKFLDRLKCEFKVKTLEESKIGARSLAHGTLGGGGG
jgi:hypothetical protein